MPATPQQLSFTRGEWSPDGWNRFDLEGHDGACRLMHNCFPRPMGGAMNRPGTQFLASVKNSANRTRLVPFIFSTQQAYALEFGHQYIRFYANAGGSVGPVQATGITPWDSSTAYSVNALVSSGGVNYYCTAANTDVPPPNSSCWYPLSGAIYEIPSPYAYSDLPLLKWDQSADTLYLVHPSYPPATLTRSYASGATNWTYTPITFGASVGSPANLQTSAGSGLAAALNFQMTSAGSGPLGTFMVAAWNGTSEGAQSNSITAPWGSVFSWSSVSGATHYSLYSFQTAGQFYGWNYAGEDPAGTSCGSPSAPYFCPSSGNQLSYENPLTASCIYTFNSNISGYYQYCVTAVDQNGHESAISNTVISQNTATLTWNSVAAAQAYNIYQQQYGLWGFIASTTAPTTSWTSSSTLVYDTSKGIPQLQNVFQSVGNYPGVVAFYQNRLWYARSNSQPQTLWGSRVGDFNNFNTSSVTQDDDSVQFTINSRRVNEIKAIIPGNLAALVHTSGGVWALSGGGGPGSNSAITPSSIDLIQQDYLYGTNDCKPISVGNNAVYADHSGGRFRDITYSIYVYGYAGTEIGIRAQHLFPIGTTAQEWDYQVYPYSIAWIVRSDGVLIGLSYQKEMNAVNLLAWHWHTTGLSDSFESVACVPNALTGQTDTFFIVNRTLNGQTVRCVEYLQTWIPSNGLSQAWFLDCATQYSGLPVQSVSGLSYLSGATVNLLADGVPYAGLAVSSSGTLKLPNGLSASVITVGLGYTSELMPMQLEYQTPSGTVTDKTRQIRSVFASLQDTAAGALGFAPSNIVPPNYPANYPWLQPLEFTWEEMNAQGFNPQPGLFTGDKEVPVEPGNIRDGTLYLQSASPLPWTLERVVARMDEGER